MKRSGIVVLTTALLILLIGSPWLAEAELRVHFIDVGHGDAILVQTPAGRNALIDGGDRWNWVADRIIDYLRDQGVETIHALVSTHPHADHIGGLTSVIESFEVKAVYDSGRTHTTLTYERYLQAIIDHDIPYYNPRRVRPGVEIPDYVVTEIDMGDAIFRVLHPEGDENFEVEHYSLNDASVALHLEYGEISFLFTGDIESRAETEILDFWRDIPSTVLKVAHHGSSTSTIPAFLDAVDPEIAVIMSGGSYDLPHEEVLKRLCCRGIKVFRTDENGTIIITTDGSGYTVTVDKAGRPRAPPDDTG